MANYLMIHLTQLFKCLESFIQSFPNLITYGTIIVSLVALIYQNKRDRKNGAIKIGEETEKLVLRWGYIDYVLNETNNEAYSVLAETDITKMKHFNYLEIDNVYRDNDLKLIESLFSENTYNSKYSGSPYLKFKVPYEVVKEANKRFPQIIKEVYPDGYIYDYQLVFQKVVINTLNKMETLSLMMVEGVANEKIVYEALGTPFIHVVKVLYYYIASTNNDLNNDKLPSDKKLKYVIKIFRKWNKRKRRERLLLTIRRMVKWI